MMEPKNQEIDLEQVKREIREDAAQLAAINVKIQSGTGIYPVRFMRIPVLNFQPQFEANLTKHYHYRELVRYDDREFIRNCYMALLQHSPDQPGEEFYLNLLRKGCSKMEIILRLRFSAEGRARKVRVQGLVIPLFRETIFYIPLFGYLIRIVYEMLLLPVSLSDLKIRQEQLRCHLNDTVEQIQTSLNAVIKNSQTSRSLEPDETNTPEE